MPITTVQREKLGKSLILRLDGGVDKKGNAVDAFKTFSNIRESATDADVLNSANVLASLQSKALTGVIVQEKSMLLG